MFFNAVESGLTASNVTTLHEVWSGRGGLSAVMDGKVVGAYWTGTGIDIVAHNVGNGAEAWSQTLTPPGAVSGYPTHPPVVTGDAVWVGYQARTATSTCAFGLSRFSLADGSLLGTDSSAAPDEMIPYGDHVAMSTRTWTPIDSLNACISSPRSTLVVSDRETGTTEWSGSYYQADTITVIDDLLFAKLSSTLRSYPAAGCGSATCFPTWNAAPTAPGALSKLSGESSGPLLAIAASSEPGPNNLVAIDKATGTLLGSTPLSFNASSLALANGTAYVMGDSTLAAFDVASCAAGACEMLWSATLGGTGTWANGLAVAGGVVYVGRQDGVVEAFAADGCGAATCPALTSVSTGVEILQLAVSNGRLFVGSIDTVTAFAPTT